jgi:hypothetical protein
MLYDSIKANKEDLIKLNEKNVTLFKEVNGPESPFILDALLSEVSVKCDLEKGEASISETVAAMRQVSKESNYTT